MGWIPVSLAFQLGFQGFPIGAPTGGLALEHPFQQASSYTCLQLHLQYGVLAPEPRLELMLSPPPPHASRGSSKIKPHTPFCPQRFVSSLHGCEHKHIKRSNQREKENRYAQTTGGCNCGLPYRYVTASQQLYPFCRCDGHR